MLLHRLLVDNITTMNVLYKYVHNNITVYIFYFFFLCNMLMLVQ